MSRTGRFVVSGPPLEILPRDASGLHPWRRPEHDLKPLVIRLFHTNEELRLLAAVHAEVWPEDTRECGWLGCGRPECEPVCAGVPQ